MMLRCVTCRASTSSCLKRARIAGLPARSGPNDLETDRAVDFQVMGFVHRAHAAHAQQFLDFVAAAQNGADFENSRADRGENLTLDTPELDSRRRLPSAIVASFEESLFGDGGGDTCRAPSRQP